MEAGCGRNQLFFFNVYLFIWGERAPAKEEEGERETENLKQALLWEGGV